MEWFTDQCDYICARRVYGVHTNTRSNRKININRRLAKALIQVTENHQQHAYTAHTLSTWSTKQVYRRCVFNPIGKLHTPQPRDLDST